MKYANGRAAALGFTEEMADPKQLKAGILIEYEHTDNYDIAKQIALDHLSELPDYYTRLYKMEKEGERYWKKKGKKF